MSNDKWKLRWPQGAKMKKCWKQYSSKKEQLTILHSGPTPQLHKCRVQWMGEGRTAELQVYVVPLRCLSDWRALPHHCRDGACSIWEENNQLSSNLGTVTKGNKNLNEVRECQSEGAAGTQILVIATTLTWDWRTFVNIVRAVKRLNTLALVMTSSLSSKVLRWT